MKLFALLIACASVIRAESDQHIVPEVQALFDAVDANNDTLVTEDELRSYYATADISEKNRRIAFDMIDNEWDNIDQNGSGALDIDEF